MKFKKSYNAAFFDKAYFLFLMKNFLKNKYLYIFLLLYGVLIISTVLIIPIAININQTELITHTIVLILYVILTGFIGSFLSINLFRTPIDDGSEILIFSKPITRKEIVFVKAIVFILSIIFFSFLSSLISLVIYFNKNKGELNDIYIVLGIFIGTTISSLFFGSISACFSLLFSKSKTILLSFAFIFIINLFSIVTMFISPNISKLLKENNSYDIRTSKILKQNKRSNKFSLDQFSYHMLNTNNNWTNFPEYNDENYLLNNMSIQDYIGKLYEKIEGWTTLNYFDIGKQLASIFTSVKLSDYIVTNKNIQKIYNPPFIYKFDNKFNTFDKSDVITTRNLNFFKIKENDILTNEEIKTINETFNVGFLLPNMEKHVINIILGNEFQKYSQGPKYNINYFEDEFNIDEKLWEKFLNEKGRTYIDYYHYMWRNTNPEKYEIDKAYDIFIKTIFGYEIQTDEITKQKVFVYKKGNHFLDFKFENVNKPTYEEINYIGDTIQKLAISALIYYSKYQLTEHYSYNKNDHLLNEDSIDLSYFDVIDPNPIDWTLTFKQMFSNFNEIHHKHSKTYVYLSKYIKALWPEYDINKTVYSFFQYLKNSNDNKHKEFYNQFTMNEDKIRDSAIKRLYLELFNLKPISLYFLENNTISDFSINKYIPNGLFWYDRFFTKRIKMDSVTWDLLFMSNFFFRPVGFFDKYTKMYIDYLYNGFIIIPFWLIVSLIIFSIFLVIYERKDFK